MAVSPAKAGLSLAAFLAADTPAIQPLQNPFGSSQDPTASVALYNPVRGDGGTAGALPPQPERTKSHQTTTEILSQNAATSFCPQS